jgi:two-component system response regulator DevR
LLQIRGARMFDALDSSNALQDDDISIKVLLADDSEIVRRGIRQLLAAQIEIQIVGEATDFAQTIRMASELNPQVVILDLHMPDEQNISPQEVKSRLNHGPQVLVISVWIDEDSRELAESLGAAVFLDKMNLANTLIPTIMQLKRERLAAV